METGAVVVCGGKSTRIGRDKALLPFGSESMLQRVIRLLSEAVPARNIIVVSAADQVLPTLPPEITFAQDLRPERGPLEGLAAGLRAMPEHIDAVYATSCDVPLLVPAFVRRMFKLLAAPPLPSHGISQKQDAKISMGLSQIAVPWDGTHYHPLAAAYRRSVLAHVEALLAADRLRLRFLFDEVRTRNVLVEELCEVDPRLDTLRNLNTPEDYHAALRSAGLETATY